MRKLLLSTCICEAYFSIFEANFSCRLRWWFIESTSLALEWFEMDIRVLKKSDLCWWESLDWIELMQVEKWGNTYELDWYYYKFENREIFGTKWCGFGWWERCLSEKRGGINEITEKV